MTTPNTPTTTAEMAVQVCAEMVAQVKAEMAVRDIKLPELASRLRVPYPTLYGWFRHPDDRLRYAALIRIAHILDVPFETLQSRAAERAA